MPSSEPMVSASEFDRLLTEAFHVGLDLYPGEDVTALVFEQHAHWDSLGHISLVVALEERFPVQLDENDVLRIDSYSAARELLKSRMTLAS